MWTVLRIWAVVNLIGILLATARGIYLDVTGDEDDE